jgi:hypothetical protein
MKDFPLNDLLASTEIEEIPGFLIIYKLINILEVYDCFVILQAL